MNKMTLECLAHLENEAFIRTSAIAFLMPLNLSMEDCMEIKTMLAEAVVNAMIHGYGREIMKGLFVCMYLMMKIRSKLSLQMKAVESTIYHKLYATIIHQQTTLRTKWYGYDNYADIC